MTFQASVMVLLTFYFRKNESMFAKINIYKGSYKYVLALSGDLIMHCNN